MKNIKSFDEFVNETLWTKDNKDMKKPKIGWYGTNAKHKVKKSKDNIKPEIDYQGEKVKK